MTTLAVSPPAAALRSRPRCPRPVPVAAPQGGQRLGSRKGPRCPRPTEDTSRVVARVLLGGWVCERLAKTLP